MLRVLLEYLSLELNFVPDGILESKFNISIFFPRFNLICVVYCNTPRFSHELDITKDKHHNTIDHFIDHHDNFGSQNHWWPMKSWHTSLTQYTNLHKHTYINYIYTYIDTYIDILHMYIHIIWIINAKVVTIKLMDLATKLVSKVCPQSLYQKSMSRLKCVSILKMLRKVAPWPNKHFHMKWKMTLFMSTHTVSLHYVPHQCTKIMSPCSLNSLCNHITSKT